MINDNKVNEIKHNILTCSLCREIILLTLNKFRVSKIVAGPRMFKLKKSSLYYLLFQIICVLVSDICDTCALLLFQKWPAVINPLLPVKGRFRMLSADCALFHWTVQLFIATD